MRIVLALDGSAESMEAANAIAKYPWPEKPVVTMVTALVDTPYDLVATGDGVSLREAENEAAARVFESARGIIETHCAAIEQVIERKHPRRLILDIAKKQDADLILLGARGHSAAYRVLLGSTADYIANHAKCSVMIVRTQEGQDTVAKAGFQILVAVDGSDESKIAVEQMCSFSWPEDQTQIHLAMRLERPRMLPDDVEYNASELTESKKSLSLLTRDKLFGENVINSVHETSHTGSAIRKLAENENVDLLFVGGTGKSAIERFFLGSTSRYVLHHTDCSIWLARTKQWN